tara:strand:- start:2713 stop:3015 length:303 start_codon:yes stop_codon:yes gene_type:complete
LESLVAETEDAGFSEWVNQNLADLPGSSNNHLDAEQPVYRKSINQYEEYEEPEYGSCNNVLDVEEQADGTIVDVPCGAPCNPSEQWCKACVHGLNSTLYR